MTHKGRGRVEVLANWDEIELMLKQGHTKQSIYQTLAKDGKITISYQMFCRYLSPRKQYPAVPSHYKPASSSKPFDHNNQVTEETRHRLLGDE